MEKQEHLKAAEHHDHAAKAHRSAAEHIGKGDHEAGAKHATIAHEESVKAVEASHATHSKAAHAK